MDFASAMAAVPLFALAFTRVAAMMLFAPLFGSGRVPNRVKALLAVVMALAVMPGVPMTPALQTLTIWELWLAMAGEILIGLSLGMVMSSVFIAAQWAGEIVGQQLGFNLSEVFDPQFGAAGSIMGDFYFMLTLVLFLTLGGHHALVDSVRESFEAVPLLALGIGAGIVDMMVATLTSATTLAFRLAAPVLMTMLVVDVAIGFLSKTMPQFNVLSAGMSMKSIVGLLVVMAGLTLTADAIGFAIDDGARRVLLFYHDLAAGAAGTGPGLGVTRGG
jgi:flagellar biosynthetic protein FliR